MASQLYLLPCHLAHHPQVSQAQSFIKRGRLLLCFRYETLLQQFIVFYAIRNLLHFINKKYSCLLKSFIFLLLVIYVLMTKQAFYILNRLQSLVLRAPVNHKH